MFKLIACIDENGAIGYKNKLLFNIKEDMEIFKEATTNNIVIMGKNTWDSLPPRFRPLPNRINIVISKSIDKLDGAIVADNIDMLVHDLIVSNTKKDIFIIGGATIYNLFLARYSELISEVYLTEVKEAAKEADTFLNMEIVREKFKVKDTIINRENFTFSIYKKCSR